MQADRARIADIAARILDMERALLALRHEGALIQERLDSFKYPILTLPNEITSEIFTHFLPGTRDIALSTPVLWRAIGVSTAGMTTQLLESWLTRAGQCLLSIKMGDDYRLGDCLSQFLPAIVARRACWEHLEIIIKPAGLAFLEIGMPSLRCLQLELIAIQAASAPYIFEFCEAPLLRTATLNYIAAAAIVLPWAQLTSLVLKHMLPQEYAPILKQTVNLVHCELICYSEPGVTDDETINLVFLESLLLITPDGDGAGAASEYLNRFILPSLRTLQAPEEFLGAYPIGILTSFISRSACQLQNVCITGLRSTSKAVYRTTFSSIPNFIFNEDPTISYHNEDAGGGE
ncbi:hypothetical protein B0H17DRAFT_1100494 [Mycena rosella]|uniref:F-box domain-containing protein n=1 Tax=Mycena rosella TaxID=1033263 RepID=A0AAD7CMR8_MYCRO|nr:hypothetical protein B0H17DRAFT_1100494 [Mycena rosella]